MNIVEELEKQKKVRGDKAPFDSLGEFEKWADAVRPLLSFNAKLSDEFSQSVTSATVSARMGNPIDANTNMNHAVGILNQAIVAAKVDTGKQTESQKAMNAEVENKSIKEKFENHPVVFGGSLLLAGLVAGVSFMLFVFPSITKPSMVAPSARTINIECNIDGLPLLNEAHDKRVLSMQERLLQFEAQASDQAIISSYQDKYLESANRVRLDIEAENNSFNKAVSQLTAKCQEVHNKPFQPTANASAE